MNEFLLQISAIPRRLSAARRVLIYNQLQPKVDARELVEVSAYIDRARVFDLASIELEARWAAQDGRGKHAEDLGVLDPRADRLLSSIYNVAMSHADGMSHDSAFVAHVHDFVEQVYPSGPGAITQLAYVEQATAMEVCVGKFQGSLAPVVAELGLTSLVEQLAETTIAYRQAVDAGHGRISFDEVSDARRRGQLFLLEILALIIGEFHDSDDPANRRARAELFAVVDRNLAEVRVEERARRRRNQAPAEDSADGESTDGESTDGESTDGESAEGESAASEFQPRQLLT